MFLSGKFSETHKVQKLRVSVYLSKAVRIGHIMRTHKLKSFSLRFREFIYHLNRVCNYSN